MCSCRREECARSSGAEAPNTGAVLLPGHTTFQNPFHIYIAVPENHPFPPIRILAWQRRKERPRQLIPTAKANFPQAHGTSPPQHWRSSMPTVKGWSKESLSHPIIPLFPHCHFHQFPVSPFKMSLCKEANMLFTPLLFFFFLNKQQNTIPLPFYNVFQEVFTKLVSRIASLCFKAAQYSIAWKNNTLCNRFSIRKHLHRLQTSVVTHNATVKIDICYFAHQQLQ